MAYDVTIVQTTACPTAVVKADTTRQQFPALWGRLLDEVWAFLRATPGLRSDGHNIMLYRNGATSDTMAVEVGVQVPAAFAPVGRVVPSILPAVEAATTIHTAAIAELGSAYTAIRTWAAAAQRTLSGVLWEVYGDPDPHTGQFAVTIYWQLA